MIRVLTVILGASVLSGCIAAGSLQRCYGVKVPFVIVGPCLRTAEATGLDFARQRPGYMGN